MFIQPKDIAKECAKYVLALVISCNNRKMKDFYIDYGCEAAWTGYYDGIDAIPGALIKYTCVDSCYHQLCKGAQLVRFDYPSSIKQHAIVYGIARVVTPILIKRCISQIIDTILGGLYDCDQENDLMNAPALGAWG